MKLAVKYFHVLTRHSIYIIPKRYVNATLRYNTRIYECLADGCRERAGKYVYEWMAGVECGE